jgi:hypothetical protein
VFQRHYLAARQKSFSKGDVKKKFLILGNAVDGHGISAARLPDKVRTCEVQVDDQVPLVHHKKSKARQFHNS